MIILLHFHSAYELYLATTEDRRRSGVDAGPRQPESSPESKDKSAQGTQFPGLSESWGFRRGRKAPVDPLKLSMRFKQTLSQPDVKVHFVGAWCVRRVVAGMYAL
jgi:hypothetical protein